MALTRFATRSALAIALAIATPLGARAEETIDAAHAAFEEARYDAAFALFGALAEGGDAEAQFWLGLLYDTGRGAAQDHAQAFEWYLSAARAGHAPAQLNVAVMLDAGRGASVDRRSASIWYARAALVGEARAAYNLGQLYEAGDGVPESPTVALAWFEYAATGVAAGEERRRALAPFTERSIEPPPAPILAADPILIETAEGPVAQLVWFPGKGAPPGRFFVEVAVAGDGPPEPIFIAFADITAAIAPLRDPDELYVWRVFTVSDGGVYSGAGWTRLTPGDGRAATLAQGSAEHGLARYDVTLRFARTDSVASTISEAMIEDLGRSNIFVALVTLDAPPETTEVVHYFAQDRAAAEAVAELLSLAPEAVTRRPITPQTPPGAIDVFIAGR